MPGRKAKGLNGQLRVLRGVPFMPFRAFRDRMDWMGGHVDFAGDTAVEPR